MGFWRRRLTTLVGMAGVGGKNTAFIGLWKVFLLLV